MVGRGVSIAAATDKVQSHGGRAKPRISLAAAKQVGQGIGALKISSSSSSDSGSNNGVSTSGTGSSEHGVIATVPIKKEDAEGVARDDDASSSSSGDGGNGRGTAVKCVGRGARWGRPLDTPAYLRTIPSNCPSKQGTAGTKVQLKTNYFTIRQKPNWRLYQYRVEMTPDIDYIRDRKRLVYQNEELKSIWFDGTILYSINLLCNQDEGLTFTSTMRTDNSTVTVKVYLVGEVDPTSLTYLQFLNIVVGGLMHKLKLKKIGRDFYDTEAVVRDPKLMKYKLELYPGYVTNFRQHEHQILLGVEIAHKICRVDTVYDQMEKLKTTSRGVGNIKDRIEKELIGQVIITKYNQKTYRIEEVRMDMSPSSEFEDTKGNKVKFYEYYDRRWGIKIEDLKQPLIVSTPKEKEVDGKKRPPIQLVPELCYMTGISDEQRNDFHFMKILGEYTRVGPQKKTQSLEKFAERVNTTEQIKEDLEKWNLKFSNKLTELTGRVLDPEQIIGSKSSTSYQSSNADWGRALSKWTCQSVVPLKKWVVIVPNNIKANLDNFLDSLMKVFPGIGMTVSRPKIETISGSKMGDYVFAMDTWSEKRPELLMVCVPNNKSVDLYSAIKTKCCVKSPIPSQVITGTIMGKEKGLMSVATKVALQMNCKLGGELWAVKIPLKNAMVVGFDVYHDTLQKNKSVGALVASLNQTFTKYHSETEFHETGGIREMSGTICGMMSRALSAYQKANDSLPSVVILYRDGVGDGQIPIVLETEVKALKLALAQFDEKIALTFIIVSKRINTKFFTARKPEQNPNSGTVIDDVVTLPERYDFFLVSQSVREGTVNPTSYNVICDTYGLKPDHVQRLTYKLTHLYYNWPGTVRVPAPVQYAHKLAFLVGTAIHKQPSNQLSDLLYYL